MFVRRARVVHQAGCSSEITPSFSRMKGHHMGYSRVYATLKHGQPMAFERAVLSAIGEMCLFPRLFSKQRRAKSLGYLTGVFSARSLVPSTLSRIRSWIK